MTQFHSELFINAIDLSPYIVSVSESGNVIGIKAPPELVRDVFLSSVALGKKTIFFHDGENIEWDSFLPDEQRGWLQISLYARNPGTDSLWLWLRFDE